MFGRSGPKFTPSINQVQKLNDRITKTFKNAGGVIEKPPDETDGLNQFDALKILISREIKKCRETIKTYETHTSEHGGYFRARKKSEIRYMIRFIKRDYERLVKLNKRSVYGDKKLLRLRENEVELIKEHIVEVERLSKRRYERKKKGNKIELEEIVVDELPSDPVVSNLPQIDITQAMVQVQRNKKKLKKELRKFQGRLTILNQQANDMTDNLDQSKEILKHIDETTEKRQQEMENVNDISHRANKKTEDSRRLNFCICVMIIVIICAVSFYVVLVQLGVFSW